MTLRNNGLKENIGKWGRCKSPTLWSIFMIYSLSLLNLKIIVGTMDQIKYDSVRETQESEPRKFSPVRGTRQWKPQLTEQQTKRIQFVFKMTSLNY